MRLSTCESCGVPYEKQRRRQSRCERCSPVEVDDRKTGEYRRLRAVVLRGGPLCHWGCGRKATTADHVVALVDGGRTELGNLVPACNPCNARRGGSRNKSAAGGSHSKIIADPPGMRLA